jgi:hypothetical protein
VEYYISNTTRLNGWSSSPVFDDYTNVSSISKRFFTDDYYKYLKNVSPYEFSFDNGAILIEKED